MQSHLPAAFHRRLFQKSMRLFGKLPAASAAAIPGLAGAFCLLVGPASGAWVSPSARCSARSSFSSSASSHTTPSPGLRSTAAPPEQPGIVDNSPTTVPSSDPPTPRVVGEGVLVSAFPGGLSAVRLIEDALDSTGDQNADVAIGGPGIAGPSNRAGGGISGDMQGREVVFPNGSTGVVVAHRPPIAFVYNGDHASDSNDGKVKIMRSMASVSITPNGEDESLKRAIFAPIPQVKDIALIDNPMLTGITAFDTLSPIGQGQNMLLIGHDLQEMRDYSMDFIRTQIRNGRNTKCVYASTTQSEDDVINRMKMYGIDGEVHVLAPEKIDADATHEASRAAEAVSIAGSACAVGEIYALQRGMNALVVIDTIDYHKLLWDTTTRCLVDVYGVDAVVKGDRDGGASSEMRAFYSSLIQRSGRYKQSRGGGSVTLLLLTTIPRGDTSSDAVFDESEFEQGPEKLKERVKMLVKRNIPLTAENLRKVDIPIPTEGGRRLVLQHVDDLISMSDGQIWFDERLEAQGRHPPLDPQRSVTRIGVGADTNSRADAPALRRIAERLRLDLSQASSMDGAEETKASQRQIRRKNALLLAMHQRPGLGGRRLSESCVALLAASEGHLDDSVAAGILAGTEEGEKLMQGLADHVLLVAADAVDEVDESMDLTESARDDIRRAIASFFEET